MIHWLLQKAADHPSLSQGLPPPGVFSAAELERLGQLSAEKRRREWILGRWTAKRLLQSFVERTSGQRLPLTGLVVGREPTGAPVALVDAHLVPPSLASAEAPISVPLVGTAGIKPGMGVPTFKGWRLPLSLSISHSTNSAFCAVHPSAGLANQFPRENGALSALNDTSQLAQVGADIEMVEGRSPRFVNDYFTPEEIRHLRDTPYDLRNTLVTATWSAKEAVLKALRLGLTVDTRLVSCLCAVDEPLAGGWYAVSVACDAKILPQASPATDTITCGWWRLEGSYVLTLAVVMG